MVARIRFAVRALAVAAASLTVALAVARELLRRQAAHARRQIGKPLGEQAIPADRVWGRTRNEAGVDAGRTPIELLIVGDSIAAGLGAERRKDTLGGRLSKSLAGCAHRPVRLRTVAIVGAESSMLAGQLDTLPDDYRPDVAVIIVGGNDITHRVPVSVAVVHLDAAIRRIQQLGAAVVVGTCPDLGALRPVPQPLRSLGARLSRQLADAQAVAAEQLGARAVSLRRTVGPFFVTQPDEMFSLDRFHPSALGYRRTAEALLPAVVAELAHRSAPTEAPGGSLTRN